MKDAEVILAQNPIRPDLTPVAPMYYPIIEWGRFPSVGAMCRDIGADEAVVAANVGMANLNRSDYTVIPQLVLGGEGGAVAVVMNRPNGGVLLCVGLFDMLNKSRRPIEKFVAKMAKHRDMRGKLVAIGEFRPNPAAMPN